MNGHVIGTYSKKSSGANEFSYDNGWLNLAGSRPISLSMPLRKLAFKGDNVFNYFDNLLPDNPLIRERIVARYKAPSSQPFDLLTEVGQDCVGALQFVRENTPPPSVHPIAYQVLTQEQMVAILQGYQSGAPLGMITDLDDFRISIAGAQEKTALLFHEGTWCLPLNTTPTTHIIKLPIGKIKSHSHIIDLSDSVENEFICMSIAKEFGLPVPNCEILEFDEIKALAVERFDRVYDKERNAILRLPQEDYCQVLNIPSGQKYEQDGGPGIKDIMAHLMGSSYPLQDREMLMKTQVIFWLLGAIDGHAKNFSVFIGPHGTYRLTPLYDILSAYPVLGGQGLHMRDLKLAMGLKGSKGKKYECDYIYPRHFLATANEVGFNPDKMQKIINQVKAEVEVVIDRVTRKLPIGFPETIANAIFSGMRKMITRC